MVSALSLKSNLEIFGSCEVKNYRKFVDQRLKSLQPSWKHMINFPISSNATIVYGSTAMAIDPVENRFLLCGAFFGSVSVVDLESYVQRNPSEKPAHRIFSCSKNNNHRFLVSSCQWYSKDSSVFATSSHDGTVKIWDANMMRSVEKFEFDKNIVQMHWSVAKSRSPLIAVALNSSNIPLIDTRAGHAIHHLRWKSEEVHSVQWSLTHENMLFTGGHRGHIALWDVRSGKSELKTFLNPERRYSPITRMKFSDDGLYFVAHDRSRTFEIWDANSLRHKWTIELGLLNSQPSSTNHISFDLCHEGTRFLAIAIAGTEVAILELDSGEKRPKPQTLKGHYKNVVAAIYRPSYHQVISSSSDKTLLVWSPAMDEVKSDEEVVQVNELHQDAWSDEEFL